MTTHLVGKLSRTMVQLGLDHLVWEVSLGVRCHTVTCDVQYCNAKKHVLQSLQHIQRYYDSG